jgi:glycine/D-amino acid oxidase-like deaminating enzyme
VPDVVVIGAGAFGAWTAHHLSSGGARVTLVDAYGPGNSRSSSGDESRILRCGYGADEIYSRFARHSREQWRKLDGRHDSGLSLWHGCGVLWLAPEGDSYFAHTRATLQGGHYPIELLDRATLRARYPHLDTADVGSAMLEPEGGVIMARRAIQALASELTRQRVLVTRGRAAKPSTRGRVSTLHLSDGTTIAGDTFVFACGAWLPSLFPDLLGQRIRPTRQVVLYFGTPSGDDRLTASHTPAWVDFASGIYGVPDLEGRGLKVGIDTHGPLIDPDSEDRRIDDAAVATARAWLQRRCPSMASAPLVESRVCQYENTATGDFLIDRHPDHENVWLVGGGSGHGFKHGPAVGEYVAGVIAGSRAVETRFALETKGTFPQRAVY